MQATQVRPTRRQRLALKLNEKAFGELMKAVRGDLLDYQIGELFGYDDSEWSLIKTGKRYVPQHMLTILTHELLPGVAVNTYTYQVPYQPRSER